MVVCDDLGGLTALDVSTVDLYQVVSCEVGAGQSGHRRDGYLGAGGFSTSYSGVVSITFRGPAIGAS